MSIKINVGKRESKSRLSSILGGLICGSLAITGLYIAIIAPSIDGGIPFIPENINQTIGRLTIGGSSVLIFLLALYAFYEAIIWKNRNHDS